MNGNKLRLRDKENKALGTIGGINPDATANDIRMFINGINGLRDNGVYYSYLVSEVLVYSPESD